jgi:hypothetical protein
MRTPRRTFFFAWIAALLAAITMAAPARAFDGVLVTFTSGTGDGPGKIIVTNAGTGSTTTVGLVPRLSASACAEILSTAAPKVGLKTELAGTGVKVLSRSAVIRVEGATITKSDL